MLRKFAEALEGELPGEESKGDVLTFAKASAVFVHAEGENQKLEGVREITVGKDGRTLRVIKA